MKEIRDINGKRLLCIDSKTLRGANLQNVYLQNAYLQGEDISNANLTGANLQGANLQGADVSGVIIDEGNLWDLVEALGIDVQ